MSRESEQDYSYLIAPPRKNGQDVVVSDFSTVAGRVIVIGDIHGAEAFYSLVNSLGPNDRVVSVGDLADRGPLSFEVLKKMMEDPRFSGVRGNHEEILLRYMVARRKIEEALTSKTEIKKQFNDLLAKLSKETNGVEINKLLNRLLNFLNEQKLCSKAEAEDYRCFLQNGGDWANKKTIDELTPIEAYIDGLPYIRKVILPDNNEFLVCHADMSSISDSDVTEYLNGKKKLTPFEKAQLTWARANDKSEVSYQSYAAVRDENSIRSYGGHEIVTRDNISVVREKTNHINLDFGACFYGPLVGVEHPNKVVVFGDIENPDDKFFEQLVKLHEKMGGIEFNSIGAYQAYKDQLREDLKSTCYLNLSHQKLSGQDFSNANLSNLDLSGLDLSGANLSGANLSGANLSGANLRKAILTKAKVDKAIINGKTKFLGIRELDKMDGDLFYETGDKKRRIKLTVSESDQSSIQGSSAAFSSNSTTQFRFGNVITTDRETSKIIARLIAAQEKPGCKHDKTITKALYQQLKRDVSGVSSPTDYELLKTEGSVTKADVIFIWNENQSAKKALSRNEVVELLTAADNWGVPRDLSFLNLSGCDLTGLDLRNTNFKGADMSNVTIDQYTKFDGCSFEGVICNSLSVQRSNKDGSESAKYTISNTDSFINGFVKTKYDELRDKKTFGIGFFTTFKSNFFAELNKLAEQKPMTEGEKFFRIYQHAQKKGSRTEAALEMKLVEQPKKPQEFKNWKFDPEQNSKESNEQSGTSQNSNQPPRFE